MIMDVASVAGPFVVLAGVVVVYVSMRRLRITMVALRQTCERLAVMVAADRNADE